MIQHIFDHVERALAWLPGYHRVKPGVSALISTAGDAFQELEDAIFDAYTGELLDEARGEALDRWGESLGVLRLGLEDPWYRRLIRGRIRARSVTGTVEDVRELWGALTGGWVEVYELPPRGLQLVAWRDTYMPRDYAIRAAAMFRAHAPTASVVLAEAVTLYLGGYGRVRPPYGSPAGRGIPARVH